MRDTHVKISYLSKSSKCWKLMWDAKHSLNEIMVKRETPKIQIHSLDAITHKIEEVKEASASSLITQPNYNLWWDKAYISNRNSELSSEGYRYLNDTTTDFLSWSKIENIQTLIKFCDLWSNMLTKNNTRSYELENYWEEWRWLNPELPPIKELIAIKKNRKRRAIEADGILLPQKFDKNNAKFNKDPSNYSKKPSTDISNISKKIVKRHSKLKLKAEETMYNHLWINCSLYYLKI